MRVVKAEQMTVSEVAIADIFFDKKSRDDIPKVLCGLQHLYLNKPLRESLFALLESELLPKIDKALGRPGILHPRVMADETDDKAAVSIVRDARHKFPDLRACSFDKGFHSPANQQALAEQLDQVVLPHKGKLSQERRAIEHSVAFKQARRNHAAVESAINALEVHGLDQCPDHGIVGFKRYVALTVVARNIHRIGDIRRQQQQAREKRQRAAKQGWQNKAAA